ncbi:sulfatase-like hydrolase/transferase [candidate division KSB1 bacterium]|nr:sulfatase-like hydrolase/transferase [candidate division KSB1 bacterium]
MKSTRREFTKTLAAMSAGLSFGLGSGSCENKKSEPENAPRPNILWIIAEDVSPMFGCYGDPDAATPHIDRYAGKSFLFKNAFTTAPICAPSRSCLATGMYATSLGTQNLRSEVSIPEKVEPLAKLLRQNGYWTALRGKTDYNFDPEGLFDYWEEDTAPWRQCPKDKPFFAFLNLGSTHEGSGNHTARAEPALKRLPPELKHDPEKISLPPYYPDTPEMRRIWARYHDLITVWDLDVNQVLKQLADDGRVEDTVVFLMADHGLGVPRYKRWLYLTGLHVPLIIHVPEKFLHFTGRKKSPQMRDELVSFVDLPPTVLKMAGIAVPDNFQGRALFDKKRRKYIFGARDRADDMYDLSRAVFDGRYLYIRHYLPHIVPMQEGLIMGAYTKESHIELWRIHEAGKDTEQSKKLWSPRPFEELYDIQNDPQELENIADKKELFKIKQKLAARLREWIFETRDSGFLTEPDMHRRAIETNVTVYDILQDPEQYPIEVILNASEQASLPESRPISIGGDPIVTFWAIQQHIIQKDKSGKTVKFLQNQINHPNATVRTAAAEALARLGHEDMAIPIFRQLLNEKEPNMLLYVARSLAVSLKNIKPLEIEIRQTRQRMLAPPGSRRPWKDFNYSAFTTWALEWALIKSGLNTPEDFDW